MATRLYNHYGENRLVEPNPQVIRTTWKQVGDYLRTVTQPGVYRDRQAICEILQSAFDFVQETLHRLLPKLASREFMEFVLYQYDLAADLWNSTPNASGLQDLHRESHLASRRRALKHLAEQTALLSPPEFAPDAHATLIADTEAAILCADILVTLFMMIDRTRFLFPEHSQLTLFKSNEPVPVQLNPVSPFETADCDLHARFEKDREQREKYLPNPTADRDPKFQADILDEHFCNALGIPYHKFLFWLDHIIEHAVAAPGSYPITFYPRDKLAGEVASCGIPYESAKLMLAGFTLRSSDMKVEGRKLWNVKQTYRAYRRGFFEMPHPSGEHVTWSVRMARESLNWLITGASFKKLPQEWKTPETTKGIERLSLTASSWFEKQTADSFAKVGIIGSRRKQGHNKPLKIPSEVGELDFLGYCRAENALVLAESKLVENRMDLRFWRDDVSEFITDKNAYAVKFRKKLAWVVENCTALGKVLIGREDVARIQAVMLTLYPSFASMRIGDFPCVSLPEFMADFASAGRWPYQTGIFSKT